MTVFCVVIHFNPINQSLCQTQCQKQGISCLQSSRSVQDSGGYRAAITATIMLKLNIIVAIR